jgi:hypothetical protein
MSPALKRLASAVRFRPFHFVFKYLQPSVVPVWFHLVPKTKTGYTGIRLTPTHSREPA